MANQWRLECHRRVVGDATADIFLRDYQHDVDFCAFMSIWFFEEQKHSLTLLEYLRRFVQRFRPLKRRRPCRSAFRVRACAPALEARDCTPAARCAWLIGTAAPQRIISSRLSSTVIPCRPMTRRGTRASIATIC